MKLRSIILWATLALSLGVVNLQVIKREQLAAHGQVMYLQLAPVDPRSLMQGDYMRLRYALVREVPTTSIAADGALVMTLDARQIASFDRIYIPGSQLAANERLLAYHLRGGELWIGPDSFFFQEGQAAVYQNASYAEFRVSAQGEAALVSLRDEALHFLGRTQP